MRRFSSYGPIDPKLHYYAPREELINRAYTNLVGEKPGAGGHYITVWAPRQTGKTWVMQEVVERIKKTGEYEVGIISMERAKEEKEEKSVVDILIEKLQVAFAKTFPAIESIKEIPALFTKKYFQKPAILILDEFDALDEALINRFSSIFRDIFISRSNERDKQSREKTHLLHGLALVGVRSVLGIENRRGSPFNVQRSLHVPNLAPGEVKGMFAWYEKESGQEIEARVVDRLFAETRGQPGLTCWLGELLTEGCEDYSNDTSRPIGMEAYETVLAAATDTLPNNNILNIISKARQETNKYLILEMFQTHEKVRFRFDDPPLNSLYMNGVLDKEKAAHNRYYARFSSPLVQKRLFNYFSRELFRQLGQLAAPFSDIDHVFAPDHLNIRGLMQLYQTYLDKNSSWLFKEAPRRSDLRVYEAVFHFNLYSYIERFLQDRDGVVIPEFPTGNGKIDLLIRFMDKTYGIELKNFTDRAGYQRAVTQAAQYGSQLQLAEIYLVTFVESVDEKTRETYEQDYHDAETDVTVKPLFIQTGRV